MKKMNINSFTPETHGDKDKRSFFIQRRDLQKTLNRSSFLEFLHDAIFELKLHNVLFVNQIHTIIQVWAYKPPHLLKQNNIQTHTLRQRI